MAVCIDISFAFHDLPQIFISDHEVLERAPVDIKCMGRFLPGIRFKREGLDQFLFNIVEGSFCLNVTQLDKPGADTEVGNSQLF